MTRPKVGKRKKEKREDGGSEQNMKRKKDMGGELGARKARGTILEGWAEGIEEKTKGKRMRIRRKARGGRGGAKEREREEERRRKRRRRKRTIKEERESMNFRNKL